MTTLDVRLRDVRDAGRKALVPYFMGGLTEDWIASVRAAAFAGADAIEIGVPFSDPIMDGVVIQEAATASLARGTTLSSVLEDVSNADVDVPLIVMTYFNIFHHHGVERSLRELHDAGFLGAIVPDLSLEEVGPWRAAANQVDVASILMVAPSSPADRVERLAQLTQGFCYASARMAVTGVASDGGRARGVVEGIRATSEVPTYVGIGISNEEQAVEACVFADGVIVGSALVERLMRGGGPAEAEQFVGSFRRAIDASR